MQKTSPAAARTRATDSASAAAGGGTATVEAFVVTSPATSMLSFTAIGSPSSGPAAARSGASMTAMTAFSGRPSRSSRS